MRLISHENIEQLSKILNQSIQKTLEELKLNQLLFDDIQYSVSNLDKYFTSKGLKQYNINFYFYDIYDFCMDNPDGSYIVATDDGIFCVINGEFQSLYNIEFSDIICYWR